MPDSITFGELFDLQATEAASLRVTVQQIADDPENVTVTPVNAEGRCGCASALVIPAAAVATMLRTDDTAVCCGKRLRVVELELVDPVLASVLAQVHARAARSSAPSPAAADAADPFLGVRTRGMTGSRPPFPPVPLGERPWSKTRTEAWPDLGCLARYYACLVLCGGFEGCAEVCYQDYMQCSGGG